MMFRIIPPLKRHVNFKSLYQGTARVIDANYGEDKSEADNEVIIVDLPIIQDVSLQFQVEVTGPNKTQHCTCKAADETH